MDLLLVLKTLHILKVQYLRDETLKTLSYENLFDFITTINVELILSSKKE